MSQHIPRRITETKLPQKPSQFGIISPVLTAYYSQFPDTLKHRDSFDALGLGQRKVNTISIKVILPDANQTEKYLDIPLKYTVDKVKAAIFSNDENLRNESMLDYQLAISEDERLEVEFVRFSECHETIRRAVALNKIVDILVLPKNQPRRKLLIRSLSQQNVRNKIEKRTSNLSSKSQTPSKVQTPSNTNSQVSPRKNESNITSTKTPVSTSKRPLPPIPLSTNNSKEKTSSTPTSPTTSVQSKQEPLSPSSLLVGTTTLHTSSKRESTPTNSIELTKNEPQSNTKSNQASSSNFAPTSTPPSSDSSISTAPTSPTMIVVTQAPNDEISQSSQEDTHSTKKGFLSKIYSQGRSVVSMIASPRILLRKKQSKSDKNKLSVGGKNVSFSSSSRLSNVSNDSPESSEETSHSSKELDTEFLATRTELCRSLDLSDYQKKKRSHSKKRAHDSDTQKLKSIETKDSFSSSHSDSFTQSSTRSSDASIKLSSSEKISPDRQRSSSFTANSVISETLTSLQEQRETREEKKQEHSSSKSSRSKSRERKPKKPLHRQESDTVTIKKHRHRIRHSKENIPKNKTSTLEQSTEKGSDTSLVVSETHVDKTKPRQRSQSKVESEESSSEATKRHQDQNITNVHSKEETEYELEVANEDEQIDYRTLAMSRTGTLRAYKRETELITTTSTTRTRSNSVLVSSRSTGDFFSKRKSIVLDLKGVEDVLSNEDIAFSGKTFEPSRVEKLRRGSFSLVEGVRLTLSENRNAENAMNLPILMRPCKGYWVEATNKLLPKDYMFSFFEIDNAANDVLWYKKYFVDHEHQNYFGRDEKLGPYIVSVMKDVNPSNENSKLIRVLLRTKKGDERSCIRDKFIANKSRSRLFKHSSGPSIETILKAIKPSLNRQHIKLVKNPQLVNDLQIFEERLMVHSYKFGVLFCKEGQTREEEMFSNEHGTEAFEKFLTFLGQKIRLQGWTGYRGGLDIQCDTTGLYSIFTEFRGFEIMFHISTYLPYTPENPQQVERKRHLGNDIVVIIFKEGNTPYLPNTITSEYNHVYLVVAPVSVNSKLCYQLACGSKDGVPSFGPEIPEPPIFEPNDYFREFLLCKLINGERAAYKSPTFAKKIQRTRLTLIKDLEEKYI